LTIGDPGGNNLFADPVYDRGGMTLHALRLLIGDDDFFRLLPAWSALREDANVTTAQFVALAEQISGQQLDAFFQAWLFTPDRPPLPPGATVTTTADQPGPRIIGGGLADRARPPSA